MNPQPNPVIEGSAALAHLIGARMTWSVHIAGVPARWRCSDYVFPAVDFFEVWSISALHLAQRRSIHICAAARRAIGRLLKNNDFSTVMLELGASRTTDLLRQRVIVKNVSKKQFGWPICFPKRLERPARDVRADFLNTRQP